MHLFVDNLTNVDFSYLHPQRGLVGETWLASIVLEGALDQQGMVCDFGIVKKTVRNWLDEHIDHCLLVAEQADNLTHNTTHSDTPNTIELTWQYGDEKQHLIECKSPHQAITLIHHTDINAESVSAWCVQQLRQLLPDTIDRIILSFQPEPIEHYFYHYSHGLKKHAGNCQRIAHGHRSTIEIVCDGKRDHQREKEWCERWRDSYIGTKEDISVPANVLKENVYFSYQSEQGYFDISLPRDTCHIIDTDSTVEFIAQYIAQTLKEQSPQHAFQVKAYEGVGKGAIAFA
ncbi:MAG: 6-carboxytetrahydropterin synthase [Cellvibrionaceae bacterium]